jgi:hypothetical protein
MSQTNGTSGDDGPNASANPHGRPRTASRTSTDFMGRAELRPVRLQLELLKPDLIMQEQGVQSTVVVFGGTRVIERPSPNASSPQRRKRWPRTRTTRVWCARCASPRTC